ncbi:MAG: hypothetical protein HY359_08720 [Candidatus Rokubacteria bacterium]|nr:hypothetical protein [Candidatus Rokubacteria bacterium]
MFDDPQVCHLGLITEVERPGYGALRVSGFPFGAPATIRRPAARLGKHTAEVLEELGLAHGEVEQLAAAGVVTLGV